MPILQNKLVWKSIEALHDEAVAAMPDAAIDIGIVKSRPTAILQQSAATQTPFKTAGGDDVMARIDQLLGKLDEDNDTSTAQSAPPANDQTASTEIADEATATITQADVKHSIRTKSQHATIVIRVWLLDSQQYFFSGCTCS